MKTERKSEGAKVYWIVISEEGELGKHPSKYLGTIEKDGKIRAFSAPRGYKPHVRLLLEQARDELVRKNVIVDVAGSKLAAAKKRSMGATGGMIARASTGQSARFHDFAGANRWAQAFLQGAKPGTQVGFFHDSGMYANAPFQVMEKNEYRVVMMTRLDSWKPKKLRRVSLKKVKRAKMTFEPGRSFTSMAGRGPRARTPRKCSVCKSPNHSAGAHGR